MNIGTQIQGKHFLVLIILIQQWVSFSQLKTDKAYYELKNETVKISLVSNELQISSHVYEKKVFNKQVSGYVSTDKIHNGSFEEIENIKAKVSYINDKGKLKQSNVDDITKTRDQGQGGVFYSEDYFYEVRFPNVKAGSSTELEYDNKIKDPHFLNRFFFSDYLPVKKATYKIITDEDIEIGWFLQGDLKKEIVFDKKNENGKNIYTWVIKNVKNLSFDHGHPGYLHQATHIVVHLKKYKKDGKTISVLDDVNGLATWYKELLSRIDKKDNDELLKLTQEITKGSKNQLEKAQRIFQWVQENIRYIAFEDGWRGFVPYPAKKICDSRYGDCKDMSHIMKTMMTLSGIEARHTWVGTRSIPYDYNDVPSIGVDNHMILVIKIDGKFYVLDATDSHAPFGVPTSHILSKTALVEGDKVSDFQLFKIPAYEPEFCTISQDITLNVDGKTAFGKFDKAIETFEYSYFNNIYQNKGKEKDKFLDEYLELAQNNCSLSEVLLDDLIPNEKLGFTGKYQIPNYIRSYGEVSYVNLNLTKPYIKDLLAKNRKSSFEIKYKKMFDVNVSFELPENAKINTLPEDGSFKNEVGEFSYSYRLENNVVLYKRIVKTNDLLITPDQFEKWNNFVKQLTKTYNTTITYQ